MQAPGKAGQRSGDDERNGEQPRHIDTQALNVLHVLDSRADRFSGNGTVQKDPDPQIDKNCGANDYQSVDRNVGAKDAGLNLDRHRHRAGNDPPEEFDDADSADQDPERGDHAECQLAFVDAPKNQPLHGERGDAGNDRASQHAEPHAARRQAERVGEVRADRVIEQLVEADDAHQPKAQRQAYCHQEIDAPDAQSEYHSGNQQLRVHQRRGCSMLAGRLAVSVVALRLVKSRSSRGCSVPQMPFSPASMMNTSRKPMNSPQLPISLLITSFMPVYANAPTIGP